VGGPHVPLPRGADLFKKRLKIALRHLDPRLPILKIDTWNDWGEWSYFEPTVKEGFACLEALKSPLEGYIENSNGNSFSKFQNVFQARKATEASKT
jgi:hypothetical protein